MLLHRTIQNNGIDLNYGINLNNGINLPRQVASSMATRSFFLADFTSSNGSRLCSFIDCEGLMMVSTWAMPNDSHSLTLVSVSMTPGSAHGLLIIVPPPSRLSHVDN